MPDQGESLPAEIAYRDHDHTAAICQRIFETSLDLILVIDKRGTLLRVSPSAKTLLDYEPEEMVGRSAREFLYAEDLDDTREAMRRARRQGETRNFECRYVHRDGRPVPMVWTGVWSEPEQNYFFIGRDISRQLAVEERVRQAQRMEAIGQLTGGMAHDFNNLFGVVIGNLDMVRTRNMLDREDDELVDGAIQAALSGADLIRRLLAFACRQRLRPRRVAINALVESVSGILLRTIGEEIAISIELDPAVWPVFVDPSQLEASLINLATNARDAMPDGGFLTIRTTNRSLDGEYASVHPDAVSGDYAVIEVSDTGSGIPPEAIGRIFEPFFTTKGPGKGTGLGLSMIYGFVRQSGGHIEVRSEADAGTIVRIYLPRARSAYDDIEAAKTGGTVIGGTETILVVEDNAAMRKVAVRQLSQLGYRVLEADGASSALAVLGRQPVTLLFTDIIMPGELNGIQLACATMTMWPDIKVLLTSGFSEAGANGIDKIPAGLRLLSKPYRREELARVVREVLDA